MRDLIQFILRFSWTALQQGMNLPTRMLASMFAGEQGQAREPAAGESAGRAKPPVDIGRLNTGSLVVLGEGLAAGMGNFSLSSDYQEQSFPAQMARQMGVEFRQPLFQPPGI